MFPRALAIVLLAGAAAGWSPRAGPVSARTRVCASTRALVRADDDTADGPDELSGELNKALLRMPRIMDAKRVAYEKFRERKQQQTEQARGTAGLDVDNVEIPLDAEPTRAPPEPATVEEIAAMPAVAFDEEIVISYEDDEEEGQEVDLENDDFNAADNYLNSL